MFVLDKVEPQSLRERNTSGNYADLLREFYFIILGDSHDVIYGCDVRHAFIFVYGVYAYSVPGD